MTQMVLTLVLALGAFQVALAGEVASVPCDTGLLYWTWKPGQWTMAGKATDLIVQCGSTPGEYPLASTESPGRIEMQRPGHKPPEYGIPISAVIPGPGRWYCIARAINEVTRSLPSPEVQVLWHPKGVCTIEPPGATP